MESSDLLKVGAGIAAFLLISNNSNGSNNNGEEIIDNVVIPNSGEPCPELPPIQVGQNAFEGDSLVYSFGILEFNSAVRIPGTPLISPSHIEEILLNMGFFDQLEIAALSRMTDAELVALFTYYILHKFNQVPNTLTQQNAISAINNKYRVTFPLL